MAADAALGNYGGFGSSNRNRHGGQYGGRDIRRDNNRPSRRQDQAQSWQRAAPINQNRNMKDSW